MPVRRIDDCLQSGYDGTVTYDLGDGRYARFYLHAIERYGLAALLAEEGVKMSTERVPVMQRGRRVGTVPGWWDPMTARSATFLYDMRPGDFRRDGDVWVAAGNLGPGDLEAVSGFVWEAR